MMLKGRLIICLLLVLVAFANASGQNETARYSGPVIEYGLSKMKPVRHVPNYVRIGHKRLRVNNTTHLAEMRKHGQVVKFYQSDGGWLVEPYSGMLKLQRGFHEYYVGKERFGIQVFNGKVYQAELEAQYGGVISAQRVLRIHIPKKRVNVEPVEGSALVVTFDNKAIRGKNHHDLYYIVYSFEINGVRYTVFPENTLSDSSLPTYIVISTDDCTRLYIHQVSDRAIE